MRFSVPVLWRLILPLAAVAAAAPLGNYSLTTFRAASLQAQGEALLPTAKYDEAVRAYQRARSLTPRNAALSRELGNAYLLLFAFRSDAGYATSAIAAMRRAVALNPLDARNSNELGWTLMASGRYEEAAQAFQRALERDPLNVHNIYSLGRLYERRGDLAAAAAQYERALQIRDDPEVRARLAHVRERR